MSERLAGDPLRRLAELGPSLVAGLDFDQLLGWLLETAQRVTGARFAVLAVFDPERQELERFLTRGLSPDQVRAVEAGPFGRGLLGLVLTGRRALRIEDLGVQADSSGFPPGHPPMTRFLGVPILIGGEPCGAAYLTDRPGGEFDDRDEHWLITIAAWAATAVEQERLLTAAGRREQELERAVRVLEATQVIALAVGAETDLARVLELVAQRGLAVVGARDVLILLRDGDELVVAVGAGVSQAKIGARIPIEGTRSGETIVTQRSSRVLDVNLLPISPEILGVRGAHASLIVPMVYRGTSLGVLSAFDRDEQTYTFTEQDEQVLVAFAASAATAVATAQSVQADRLRAAIEAAEAERKRWARELHDETLHTLGGLKTLASAARREADPARIVAMLDQLVDGLEAEIENVHAIVGDLRPPALDDLGLRPAIEFLVGRYAAQGTIEVTCQLELPDPGESEQRLAPELETTVYRFVQEALTNVANHAEAGRLRIDIAATTAQVTVEVADDGRGFDVSAIGDGFGLTGMRERVTLAGGTVEIVSSVAGTIVRATLPARYAEPPFRQGTGGG